MTKKPLPKGYKNWNDEELARFWDSHSTVDYEFEEEWVYHPRATFTIRIDPKNLDALRKLAARKGIGHTTLARMWIVEKLHEAQQQKVVP